jgi:hypothetical protein
VCKGFDQHCSLNRPMGKGDQTRTREPLNRYITCADNQQYEHRSTAGRGHTKMMSMRDGSRVHKPVQTFFLRYMRPGISFCTNENFSQNSPKAGKHELTSAISISLRPKAARDTSNSDQVFISCALRTCTVPATLKTMVHCGDRSSMVAGGKIGAN